VLFHIADLFPIDTGLYALERYAYIRGGLCTLPVDHDTIYGFVLSLTGSIGHKTILQMLTAIQCWHQVHGVKFPDTDDILNWAAHGAKAFDPPQSKRGPRKPMTIALLNAIIPHLSLINPVHVAVLAAATAAFFGIARLGKIVLKRGRAIGNLPKRKNLREDVLLRGHIVTIVHIPWTKVGKENSEDIYWASHPLLECCPVKALRRHLRMNNPGPTQHLFGVRQTGKAFRPLSHATFVRVLNNMAKKAHVILPLGHSFRIGGTNEYLLRGVPFEEVKIMGRWRSDAFRLYLRKHAEIIAPFLQPSLEALTSLLNRIELTNEERANLFQTSETAP
jgi:hypothetical protein